MDSPTSPVIYTERNTDNFFRKKSNTTVSFAFGILLFFLPFAQITCGSVTVAENTGLGLATGTEWKISSVGGINSILKEVDKLKGNKNREKIKLDRDWFLLLALIFAGAGIVFSLCNWSSKQVASMSAGMLAAVMLVAALIHLRIMVRSGIPLAKEDDSLGMDYGKLIKIRVTIWYYLSLAAFITASFFGYKHHVLEMNDAMERAFKFDFQAELEE